MYIELAVGQGETLASANQMGTPYRMVYDKLSQQVSIVSFASYRCGKYVLSKADHERIIRFGDLST